MNLQGISGHLNATPTDSQHEVNVKRTLRLLIKSLVNAVCVLKRARAQIIKKESYCSNNRYTVILRKLPDAWLAVSHCILIASF